MDDSLKKLSNDILQIDEEIRMLILKAESQKNDPERKIYGGSAPNFDDKVFRYELNHDLTNSHKNLNLSKFEIEAN